VQCLRLACPTSVGLGGYVATEKATGTLDGRVGSFRLQHSSTMNRGVPQQPIIVPRNSGTKAVTGLAGGTVVEIALSGAHGDHFNYTLH